MTSKMNDQYSLSYLEKQSYKYLQTIAKSIQLPANIKKEYLVQLIHAKHAGNDADVKKITEEMRVDREGHPRTPKSSGKNNMTSPFPSFKTRSREYQRHLSRKGRNSSYTRIENRRVSVSSSTDVKSTLPPIVRGGKISGIKPKLAADTNFGLTELRTYTKELRKKSQNFERRLSSEMVEGYFNCMKQGEENGVYNHSNEITDIDTNDFMSDLDNLYIPDCLPELEVKFGLVNETYYNNNEYNSNNEGNANSIHQINEPNSTMDLSDVSAVFAKFNLNFGDLSQPLPIQSLKDLETVDEPLPNPTTSTTNGNSYVTCNVADAASAHITTTHDIKYDTAHSQQPSTSKTRVQSVETMDTTELVEIMETTDLGPNLTFSEEFENACEIIAQDGDYMEKINMDTRVWCIFCIWSGPSMIYGSHMRKEHLKEILRQTNSECIISYCVGSIMHQNVWICRVLEIECRLYLLGIKYDDPDSLMITISTISCNETQPVTGSLTVYNKVTGEPYTWEGQITGVFSNLHCGLQLELSRLNLIPNSSNLQLLNKELVMLSPSNVVVGQPELNDIFINIHINIYTKQDINV